MVSCGFHAFFPRDGDQFRQHRVWIRTPSLASLTACGWKLLGLVTLRAHIAAFHWPKSWRPLRSPFDSCREREVSPFDLAFLGALLNLLLPVKDVKGKIKTEQTSMLSYVWIKMSTGEYIHFTECQPDVKQTLQEEWSCWITPRIK